MALAGETQMVAHGNFRDGIAFDFEQGGQEPVHALEKFQVAGAFAFEHAVATRRITDGFVRYFIAHAVGDFGRDLADEIIALAAVFQPRTAHAIVLFQRFEKFRQVLRVVLQVGVQRGDELAARRLDARP